MRVFLLLLAAALVLAVVGAIGKGLFFLLLVGAGVLVVDLLWGGLLNRRESRRAGR